MKVTLCQPLCDTRATEVAGAPDKESIPLKESCGEQHSQFPNHVQLPSRGRFCLEPILREACSQAYPVSAICVQRFDDSLSSAIRITYRISLRSSSLWEPRYPLLRVVLVSYFDAIASSQD